MRLESVRSKETIVDAGVSVEVSISMVGKKSRDFDTFEKLASFNDNTRCRE